MVSIIIWNVVLCSLAEVHLHFDRMSVNMYWAVWCHIQEDCTLHSHCSENLETNSIIFALKQSEEVVFNMFLDKAKMIL